MMYRVCVLIPFKRRKTGTEHKAGDELIMSADEVAAVRAVNVNMVLVLGEAEAEAEVEAEAEAEAEAETEAEPPKKKSKKQ